ncbi:Holliday junction branch migration protein RuvA [Candidatus Saccharibacteria bacterium]|nr:Holliday junction branch migration protein RuvA [Candidatus Saccharibacteria bacterium]MCB9820980.1 Holliday junction branch migration protein RuvA [Candidatus Nomurabacteria bacterium]
MIAYLRGVVTDKAGSQVVIDVHGLGYGVQVSLETESQLSLGKESQLVIYEHIKEDAHDLYGFLEQSSKHLFEKLLSVNGVGPKMAISLLNLGNATRLVQAITSGEVNYMQAASGVGKRLAERIVVDLKGKLGVSSGESATDFLGEPNIAQDEATQALVALGFSSSEASAALKGMDSQLSVEQRIKLALSGSKR